uniref:Uncharacterized protein n=1 Tax=Rhizophora mucronata TaxID=61149 RepID=A0A2P2PH75_RHIMU
MIHGFFMHFLPLQCNHFHWNCHCNCLIRKAA